MHPLHPASWQKTASLALRLGFLVLLALVCLPVVSVSAQQEYQRQVSAAPQPDDIGEDYILPTNQVHPPRAQWRELVDVSALALAMILVVWIALVKRSRTWLVVLTIACIAYFGFYRKGCICPIGAIQNMAVALTDPKYAVSYFTIAIFLLPLVMAVFFGRAFCGGVCPLGAIQDLVVLKPIRVPRRLDKILGLLKWVYLVLAIWLAIAPAENREFIICRFDPFVGFFRLTGPMDMMLIGAGFLLLGLFIGRAYCRYLCPYGALLSLVSRVAWRGVTISPDKEIDCGLCEDACPFGAIHERRAEKASCLYCARCYKTCPQQRVLEGEMPQADPEGRAAAE